jgi:hypothetical protein
MRGQLTTGEARRMIMEKQTAAIQAQLAYTQPSFVGTRHWPAAGSSTYIIVLCNPTANGSARGVGNQFWAALRHPRLSNVGSLREGRNSILPGGSLG